MSLTTVDVPEDFEPIFAQAEKVVSSYFAGRSHDPSRAAIEIGGERYILVRAASLSIEFFSLVKRLFGTGREDDANEFARNMLFDLSHAIGKSDAENFHTKMHLEDPIARLSAGPVHFSYSGWASVKILPESNPSPDQDYYLEYEHPQSFEADAWLRSGQKSNMPVCVMNAGYSSGWCEVSFGLPLVAVEILCRAQGDPCCRFIMAPPETIAEHVERYGGCQCDHAHPKAPDGIPKFFSRKRLEDDLRKSEESLLRHNALLRGINQVFEKALTCQNEEELAQACLKVAEQLTDSKFGFIGEVNHEGHLDTIAISDPGWRTRRMPDSDAAMALRGMEIRGIWGRVLTDGKPLITNDPSSHPDGTGTPEGHPPLSALLGIPLKHGKKTIGMIAVANKESGYDAPDQELVEALSTTFVQALMRQRSEAELRKKDEELRQSQKMEAVGLLAGGIAHEFNNLLQAISGYTRLAIEGLSSQERRHGDLQQVLTASDRASSLTRQLLGFSRRRVLQPKNVDPNEVIADLMKLVRPVFGEHIDLETVLGGDVGTVYADAGELQQVLLNLCLNARDAMPSGGKLLLKAESMALGETSWEFGFRSKPGRYVAFSVTDSGCGMTSDVRQRIFEPFFTTKEVGKGTGLGLATVYGIVQQHEGAIHVYSEPEIGTTFKVYLPRAFATADTESQESVTSVAGGTETILLAEDEPVVRELAVRILTHAGYSVVVASDGEEAIRLFQENRDKISLLLLDAVMPKLGGQEVCRHVRESNSETKVVFCTGYNPETARAKSIVDEDQRLIEKPFSPHMLLRTIREVLDVGPCTVA